MTTYRNIHGRSIKAVATDPTAEVSEGEIWYNTGSDTFKSIVSVEAWSSGGALSTARDNLAGAGIQTAALAFGGATPSLTTATEEYGGNGWSNGGDLGTARYKLAGAGTQTAGLAIGGGVPPSNTASGLTEEYGGTSWTAGGALSTARKELAGCGTQTAGLAFGGRTTTLTNATEEYNGSSWTAGGNLGANKYLLAGAGIQTAGLAFGGFSGTALNATEEYDGSSWTAGNNMGTAQYQLGGAGIQTSALGFGGSEGPRTQQTELYDGTNWSTGPNLATGRNVLAGAGANNTAALAFGGSVPGATSLTEEFTKSANVITAAAWASIANFPDSRAYSGGGGTPTSTLVFGGYDGPGLGGYVSTGAEFDGSSWTATGDYVIDVVGVAGIGPVSAGLGCGGNQDNASNVTTSAEYNGSSWTSGNSANASGQGAKMSGSQTAASMGNRSGDGDGHEEYDGTNWTAAANTPVSGNAGAMMAGTQTALLMYGGENSPKVRTELWDGSSWTSGNNMNLDRRQGSYGGTQTYAIAGGGDSNPGIFGNTELWNGTSWVSSVNMGTARFYQVGGFTNGPSGVTSNIAATGRTPGSTHSNNCEEFSSETIALNVKTLTQS